MRLDIEKQRKQTPKRFAYAIEQLQKLGFKIVYQDELKLSIAFKEQTVTLYPYSGWFTGKSVVDGRGIHELLKQLKNSGTKSLPAAEGPLGVNPFQV